VGGGGGGEGGGGEGGTVNRGKPPRRMGLICERTCNRLNRVARELGLNVRVITAYQHSPHARWYSIGTQSETGWHQSGGAQTAAGIEEDFRRRAANRG